MNKRDPERRDYTPPRMVANQGRCPECGEFNHAQSTRTLMSGTKVQYRKCLTCGSYKTIVQTSE